MSEDKWDAVRARYMTEEQRDELKTLNSKLPADFDGADYKAKWSDLGERIKAALPMDPASPKAQALLDEWQALIQPFLDAASPTMKEGFRNLYSHYDEWHEEVDSGFDPEVFRFHQAAARARETMQK